MILDDTRYQTRNSSGDEIPERDVLLPLLRLTPSTEEFPWDDLRRILHGGRRITKVQITKWRNNIAENFTPPE